MWGNYFTILRDSLDSLFFPGFFIILMDAALLFSLVLLKNKLLPAALSYKLSGWGSIPHPLNKQFQSSLNLRRNKLMKLLILQNIGMEITFLTDETQYKHSKLVPSTKSWLSFVNEYWLMVLKQQTFWNCMVEVSFFLIISITKS